MKVKGMIESDVDTFKVGDVIEVKLADGIKVQAMAVQQEEDGMVFCLVDCLPSEHPMNSTSTNEGGYEESDLRKKLNGEILNLFPAELKAIRQIWMRHAMLLTFTTSTTIWMMVTALWWTILSTMMLSTHSMSMTLSTRRCKHAAP